MSQKFDNLNALDWDDTDLIKAYNKGLTMKTKGEETSQEKKSKSQQWQVGDYCRAPYEGDNTMYEAQITAIDRDYCHVTFPGYDEDEDFEVTLKSLAKSNGKKARSKQIRNAAKHLMDKMNDSENECSTSESARPSHPKRKHHNKHHKKHMVDYSANFPSFENSVPANYYPSARMPPAPPPLPAAPPMPQCSEVVQNPALCSLLTSWYMAGYYTGLYQAQKNSSHQNCCKSSHHC